MAEFKLEVGKPRLGWLIDGDKSTPLVPALLEDTGTSIVLRLCWSPSATTPYLQRWFTGNATQWGDDPNRAHHRYSVPDVLWFQDVDGAATLVYARAVSSRTNMHFGEGVAIVTCAVLGTGGADYRAINGFRSEITGLLDWFGQGTVHDRPTFDSEGRLTSLAIELSSPAPPVDTCTTIWIRSVQQRELSALRFSASVASSARRECVGWNGGSR